MPIINLECIKDNNIPDDISIISNSKSVLYIGEVQSGKTNKILNIIDEVSNRKLYDAVIYLGGTNNFLNDQTKSRFVSFKNKNKNCSLKFCDVDWTLSSISVENFWSSSKIPLFIILKGSNKLLKLSKFFSDMYFPSKKILIIDDESDFGSLKTTKSNFSINKLIKEIARTSDKCTLLQFTATPFANIKMNNYDQIFLLTPGDEYTGSSFFIREKKYHVIDIKRNDSKKLLESVILKSFIFWMLSTSLYIYDTNTPQKSEFLINIDLKTPSHENICKYLDQERKRIWTYFVEGTKIVSWLPYVDDFFKNFNISDKQVQDKLLEHSLDIIKKMKIFVLNNKEDNIYNTGKYEYSVIIGGTLISRGFTFEHLITELILNSPNENQAIDTMLQRARWFGYRHKYDDMQKYMMIFMNKQVFNTYEKAEKLNEFLRKHYKDKDIKMRLEKYYSKELKPYKILHTAKKERGK